MAKKKDLRSVIEDDHQTWAEAVKGLSIQELDNMILRFAKYKDELEEFKKADQELADAKETVKELNAPHSENLKINGLKTKYLILLLGEKGGNTSGSIK